MDIYQKQDYFQSHSRLSDRKRWYRKNYRQNAVIARRNRIGNLIAKIPIPLTYLSFLRWILIDVIKRKGRQFWGIYQFVALPGQGKTLSMVAHMERARASRPNVLIATNFHYKHQDIAIDHWSDIIVASKAALKQKRPCIVAIDEVHITFDSADWKSFPPELLALLSFNRKFRLQFLCSAQIYDRIPKKIRDIANYTVICKNVWNCDRLFRTYYFTKENYDAQFNGKRAKAEFIREYIATDDLYNLYNTLEQVDKMTMAANVEKQKKAEAFELLFGGKDQEEESGSAASEAPRSASSS